LATFQTNYWFVQRALKQMDDAKLIQNWNLRVAAVTKAPP